MKTPVDPRLRQVAADQLDFKIRDLEAAMQLRQLSSAGVTQEEKQTFYAELCALLIAQREAASI
jgi:hypothetical protein